jgi:hypothetical protein
MTLTSYRRFVTAWAVLCMALVSGLPALANPQITSLSPSAGLVGTRVIIYATELMVYGNVTLLFDGQPIPYEAHGSANELRFTVPSTASCGDHSVQIRITDPIGTQFTNIARFTVLCGGTPPPPSPNIAQFDRNRNGRIDDSEFFAVIDQWVAGRLSNDSFFAVIDAWISQTPVRGATNPPLARVSMTLEAFNLQGQRLFVQQTLDTRRMLHLADWTDRPLANGVYLYLLTIQDQGKMIQRVGKWVVLR